MELHLRVTVVVHDEPLLRREGQHLYELQGGDDHPITLEECVWEIVTSGYAPLDYGFEITSRSF